MVDKLKGSEFCFSRILGVFLNFCLRMEGFIFFCIIFCLNMIKSSYGKIICVVNDKS